MKKILSFLALGFTGLVALALTNDGYLAKSATGTTSATVVWPANGRKAIRLVSFDVTSDLAASPLTARQGTISCGLFSGASGGATTLVCDANLGIVVNDVVCVQRVSDATIFAVTVSSVANATNLTVPAIPNSVSAGDQLFLMTNNMAITIGAATVSRTGEALLQSADPGRPLMLNITGTSSAKINNAIANYY